MSAHHILGPVSYTHLMPVSNKIVVLDAGHGGIDPGAMNKDKTILEKDINLEITKKLRDLIEASGGTVIMTRDKDVSLYEEEGNKTTRQKYNEKMCIRDSSNDDYPIDMSKHVRDPKIFKKNNYYYMVLGGRTSDNQGCVLLYKSKDLINFEYYNRIEVDDFGYMWECPDLFELDGELFLVVCPQGISQRGYDYAKMCIRDRYR